MYVYIHIYMYIYLCWYLGHVDVYVYYLVGHVACLSQSVVQFCAI